MTIVCDYCQQSFLSRKSLAFHLKTCKGSVQERFLCSYCNQSFFTTKSRFTLHVNSMHPGKTESTENIPVLAKSNGEKIGEPGSFEFDVNEVDFDQDKHEKRKKDNALDSEDESISEQLESDSDESDNKSSANTNQDRQRILQSVPESMYLAFQQCMQHPRRSVDNFTATVSAAIESGLSDEFINGDWLDTDLNTTQCQPIFVQATTPLEATVAAVGHSVQLNTIVDSRMNENRDSTLVYLDQFDVSRSMPLGMNSGQVYSQLQLLELLQNANAPLHLFDSIMQWSREAAIVGQYNFEAPSPSRKFLVNQLIGSTNMTPLLPIIIDFELPNAKEKVKVITHDIQRSIHSLLSDTELMKDENLIFKNHPLENPNDFDPEIIEDVNDGSCYKEAYARICSDPSKEVLCPLILFIDKTHTDTKGNQTLEPICLTLGIFKKEVRSKEYAWRIIGYIPSTDTVANSKLSSNEKQSDYHAMLSVVLGPLVFIQSFKGIAFKLIYKKQLYDVCLKIPILFICGDSEGQDKLVGRRLVYSNITGAKHICRYCSVPFDKTDDPTIRAPKTMAASIQKYISKKRHGRLSEMGYLLLDNNALHNLKFCDDVHGLNGSLPADLLHTWQLGLYIYISEGLFGSKQASAIAKTNRKRKMAAVARGLENDGMSKEKEIPQGQNLQGEEVSSRNVFNTKEKDRFDNLARLYGKLLSQQSDRDLPRTFFPSGITGEKKKNGHEMQGVVLNILCIFLSSENKNFLHLFGGEGIGETRLGYWILLLERFIMIEEFLKQSKFNKTDVLSFRKWLPQFLNLFKRVVDRKAGSGFKLLKFHLCTHFADDILKWGCPSSFDSATGESNHKSLKKHARRTQKNINVLVEQTGMRYVESLAIHQAIASATGTVGVYNFEHPAQPTSLKFINKAYRCNLRGIFDVNVKGDDSPTTKWHNQDQFQGILELLQKKVLHKVGRKTVDIYTGVYWKDVLYRGNPYYKGSSWQDWAYCDWGDEDGICPVQLLAFVDLTNLKEDLYIEGIKIERGYFAAIVHMIAKPLDDKTETDTIVCSDYSAHPHSWLFFKARKMMSSEKPKVALVHMESIVGPCIGVPLSMSSVSDDHEFLFLRSRKEWAETLVKLMNSSRLRKEVC